MWGRDLNSKRHVGPPPYAKPTIWKLSLLNKTRKSTISASSEILRRRLKILRRDVKFQDAGLFFKKSLPNSAFYFIFSNREMNRRIKLPLFALVPEMAATHLEVEGFLNASSAHRMAATHLEVEGMLKF